jgi:GMP synthase-like glutamine amidotransferase
VPASGRHEIGWFPVEAAPPAGGPFAADLPAPVTVLHRHGNSLDLPTGTRHIARSAPFEQQAFGREQRVLAAQCHHPQMDPAGITALTDTVGTGLAPGASVRSGDAMRQQAMHFAPARCLLSTWPTRLTG